MNGKQCQVVIKSKCYDNPKKECNSMQKFVKNITHEKDSDSGLITSTRLKMSSNVDRFLGSSLVKGI